MSFYVALLQLRSISSFKQFYTPHLRRARRLTFRERVYKTVNDPRVSPLAFTYAILLILSILVSLVSLLCSTLPENWDTPITNPRWIFAIEVSTTIVFTVDYLVRLCVVPRPYRWIWTAMALVDLFSTITLYVEVILDAAGLKSNIVSLLRVLRAVRIVKLGRFSDSFQVLGRVFRSTIDGFFMMMLLYGLGMVIWGTCLFFAEQTSGGQTFYEPNLTWYREDGTSSPFQSIPECFWWAIVTMTTTGYGDTYPKTPLGKFVTSLCALYGIIMVSFPITIFGNSFAREWKQFEVSRLEDDLQFSDEQELIDHMSRFTRRELVTFARSSMAAHSKNLTQWRSKAAEWSTEREVWDNIILDLREARRKSSLAMEIPL